MKTKLFFPLVVVLTVVIGVAIALPVWLAVTLDHTRDALVTQTERSQILEDQVDACRLVTTSIAGVMAQVGTSYDTIVREFSQYVSTGTADANAIIAASEAVSDATDDLKNLQGLRDRCFGHGELNNV